MVAMTNRNKTISFRVTEDKFDDLKEIAEDEDISLSNLMRGRAENVLNLYQFVEDTESTTTELLDDHVAAMIDEDVYREFHDDFYQSNQSFRDFVVEEDYFDTKWVDETTVDYDEMLENFQDIVYNAERHNFDEAEEMIDKMRDEGYEQEAFLFNSVVSQYRE
jgi:hypothetical protein